ncbi:MAG: bifunctional diaminohydroxyphosphoribosylaminopyrimidine deaminase/5-amino-6-(5-phosphoribosylamino)uracil reductase RibD [Pseudomonadota bacterium]
MAAAARLAMRARPLSRPNPGVAAIAVKDGRVCARGWTRAKGRPHAEADMLADLGSDALQRSTVYVTLEPCAHESERGPACSDLLAAAKPERVVIGTRDPDIRTSGKGVERLKHAGIAVQVLDHPTARASLTGYLCKEELGRPYVTLKLAMSLDGCIAMPDGSSQWITGKHARAHVHAQRARNDAILVGGGTWRADKPRLDVRLAGLEARSPQIVLLTRGVAPDAVKVINKPAQIGELEGVLHLYAEGGAGAAASFLKADLVDEIHVYRAPIVIGDGLKGLSSIELGSLDEAHGRWRLYDRRQLGSDEFTAYLRIRS